MTTANAPMLTQDDLDSIVVQLNNRIRLSSRRLIDTVAQRDDKSIKDIVEEAVKARWGSGDNSPAAPREAGHGPFADLTVQLNTRVTLRVRMLIDQAAAEHGITIRDVIEEALEIHWGDADGTALDIWGETNG